MPTAGLLPSLVYALMALQICVVSKGTESTEQILIPPFSAPWNIQRAGAAVSRKFAVQRRQFVWFEIEFYRTDGISEITTDPELAKIVGDGATIWVTEESADSDEPIVVENYHPGEYRPPGHGVRARMAHSGIMIPIHLAVQSLDDPAHSPKLDQVFKTWNVSHGTSKGVSRTIGWIELPPGHYRATATTVRATPLPANLKTRFDVHYPPPDR
jgi:hypothetical protein